MFPLDLCTTFNSIKRTFFCSCSGTYNAKCYVTKDRILLFSEIFNNNFLRFEILTFVVGWISPDSRKRFLLFYSRTKILGWYVKVSLKTVSRNRKPTKRFSIQENFSIAMRAKNIFHVFPVFVSREKFSMRKKSVRENEYWRTSAKFCLPFSYFFRTNTDVYGARKIHHLEIENEKHSLLEIISPSFSMLNFHFHTRSKKCVFTARTHKFKAGYTYHRKTTLR